MFVAVVTFVTVNVNALSIRPFIHFRFYRQLTSRLCLSSTDRTNMQHSSLKSCGTLFNRLFSLESSEFDALPSSFRATILDSIQSFETIEIELIGNQCWERAVLDGLLPLCEAWRSLKPS